MTWSTARGQADVLEELGLLLDPADRVVGDVAGLGGAAELACTSRSVVGLPRREVLVLGDPRVRHDRVAVVHDRAALEVAVVQLAVEVERAVAEPPCSNSK